MTKPKVTTLSEQLRANIEAMIAADWTVNAIAKAAVVPQSSLSCWLNGTRSGLNLVTFEKLCTLTGTRLTTPRRIKTAPA
tara:strand:+ start:132 stop:371 length:240 start_codon:yes stop_codon:yes gene_type:complete